MLTKVFGIIFLIAFVSSQEYHGEYKQEPASSYILYKQGGDSLQPIFQTESQYKEESYAYPKYQFKYGVQDYHTGDIKSQEESRDGDVVKGSYSLHEPDGTILTVHYTADKHSGFNAQVERTGKAQHPQYSSGHGY